MNKQRRSGGMPLASGIVVTLALAGFLPHSAEAETFRYDGLGRLVQVDSQAGQQRTYSYDEADNVTNISLGMAMTSASLVDGEALGGPAADTTTPDAEAYALPATDSASAIKHSGAGDDVTTRSTLQPR